MQISISNHTGGTVTDEEHQNVIRAINRQIAEDFYPYWGMSAVLRLEGRSATELDQALPADLRGDAIIYLWNEADVDGAIGYHFQHASGIPCGFVFTEIARQIGEPLRPHLVLSRSSAAAPLSPSCDGDEGSRITATRTSVRPLGADANNGRTETRPLVLRQSAAALQFINVDTSWRFRDPFISSH